MAVMRAQNHVQETSAGQQAANNCVFNSALNGKFVHIDCSVNKTTLAVTDPGTQLT